MINGYFLSSDEYDLLFQFDLEKFVFADADMSTLAHYMPQDYYACHVTLYIPYNLISYVCSGIYQMGSVCPSRYRNSQEDFDKLLCFAERLEDIIDNTVDLC